MTRPRGTDSAKIIKVIETKALKGQGTNNDPCRIVTQYWDFKGNLLAEKDSSTNIEKSTPAEEELTMLKERREHLDNLKSEELL